MNMSPYGASCRMGFLFSRRGLFESISSLGDGRRLRYASTAPQNGTPCYYTVIATDLTGYESTQSTAATATPVIATPPAPAAFTAMTPTPSTFTITWPTTHLGWILESQTGSLSAIGLTALPNSTTTTSYSAPVTPSTPGTFFRLRRP